MTHMTVKPAELLRIIHSESTAALKFKIFHANETLSLNYTFIDCIERDQVKVFYEKKWI